MFLYGPHIGVSARGEVGEITREGQKTATTCCGSLVAAFERLKNGTIPQVIYDDYQQGQVTKLLFEKHQEIQKAEQPLKTVTNIAYRQIKRELNDIISACEDALKDRKVLLIGEL